jgi:hypothetical protein
VKNKYLCSFVIGIWLFSAQGLQAQTQVPAKDSVAVEVFRPNPTRAVLYSAIFPGLGQIYNRKYWKLPIVYGGFLGCVYAITWNGGMYTGYKNAYGDFTGGSGNSWMEYRNLITYYSGTNYTQQQLQNMTPDEVAALKQTLNSRGFPGTLKSRKDMYRRNRDLSWIVSVGVYALCMIDAYVDAQLFEFDVTDNLSMRVDPVIFERTPYQANSFGLQCSLSY